MPLGSKCLQASGWFEASDYENIRDEMHRKFRRMLEAQAAMDEENDGGMDVGEAGLAEDGAGVDRVDDVGKACDRMDDGAAAEGSAAPESNDAVDANTLMLRLAERQVARGRLGMNVGGSQHGTPAGTPTGVPQSAAGAGAGGEFAQNLQGMFQRAIGASPRTGLARRASDDAPRGASGDADGSDADADEMDEARSIGSEDDDDDIDEERYDDGDDDDYDEDDGQYEVP